MSLHGLLYVHQHEQPRDEGEWRKHSGPRVEGVFENAGVTLGERKKQKMTGSITSARYDALTLPLQPLLCYEAEEIVTGKLQV